MYGMDNEEYRNGLSQFIKYLNKWREFTGNYEKEPLINYKYPMTVSIYIHTDTLYRHVNMYKQTRKSKWIYEYRALVMDIKETVIPQVYECVRGYNNMMAKLIIRKRGKIR